MVGNELLHPFEPPELRETTDDQITMGRRDFVVNTILAAVSSQLALPGVASAEERPKTRVVDVVTPDLFHPINLPKLGIHSKKLDALPSHIQRIIFYFSAVWCDGCHDVDKRMRKEWASLPYDVIVIPVDASDNNENELQKTDEELRASVEMPPLLPLDETVIEWKSKKFPTLTRKQLIAAVQLDLRKIREIEHEQMRAGLVASVNRHRQWLKEMHEFYTQKGSPGVYCENQRQNEEVIIRNPKSGIPVAVVCRRSDGRVMRRSQFYLSKRDNIWNQILGKR